MLLYTFCVYIEKHSKNDLVKVFEFLVKSLNKYIKDFTLICYTNFEINKPHFKQNIIYRKYYDKSKIKFFNNKWLNLSFNKINIYKDLYEEYGKDFTWIDLDTIVTADISYINKLSNAFIEIGGNNTYKNILFNNNNTITVPRNRYIQGNFWKLNINLYNELMKTFKEIQEKKLILRYDLQDLFSYYIYIKNKGVLDGIYILGNNVKSNNIYGLCVWGKIGNIDIKNGLNNLYYNNGELKSKFYEDKTVDILSLTFNIIQKLYNDDKFNNLF